MLRRHVARFADTLGKGSVFSMRRTGEQEMRVFAPPVVHKNLVGERSYLLLHVALTVTGEKGTMTLPPSAVVFVRAD